MTSSHEPTRRPRVAGRIAAWTVVATVALVGLAGVALAGVDLPLRTAAATPTPTASPGEPGDRKADRDKRHKRHGFGRLGRPVHGEAVVRDRDGEFLTVYHQRGTVTAVSATSIALKSEDGFVATYAVNDETRVYRDRKPARIGDVKVGERAGVMAVKSGETKLARWVVVGDPGRGRPGKTD